METLIIGVACYILGSVITASLMIRYLASKPAPPTRIIEAQAKPQPADYGPAPVAPLYGNPNVQRAPAVASFKRTPSGKIIEGRSRNI